jgi:hypothetical protein
VWVSGKKTYKSTETTSQSIDVTESRYITVTQSSWVNSGSPYGYSAWTPDSSTVNWGQSFTQTQTYKQKQTATRYYKYGSTIVTSVPLSKIYTGTNSRTATGTKDYVVSTTYQSGTTESNSFNCTTWALAGSQILYGVEFYQTRLCQKTVTNYTDKIEVWASGKPNTVTRVSSSTTTQNSFEQREAVGTSLYCDGTIKLNTSENAINQFEARKAIADYCTVSGDWSPKAF